MDMPTPCFRASSTHASKCSGLQEYVETTPLNHVRWGDRKLGIISHSMAYQYAREVFPQASFLKLGMAFPLPRTAFYDMAREEGLLETDDIYKLMIHERVRVGAKPHVRTRSLSADELEDAWRRIRKQINRYYFLRNVLLRPWDMRGIVSSARGPRQALGLLPKAVRFAVKHVTGGQV